MRTIKWPNKAYPNLDSLVDMCTSLDGILTKLNKIIAPKITITKYFTPKGAIKYRADPADMPGMPPNGIGRTKGEAIGNLILSMSNGKWNKYGWPIFQIVYEENNA